MLPRLLLDTHILIRFLTNTKKLTKEQNRVLEAAVRRHEPLAFSAASLLEISLLISEGSLRMSIPLEEFFNTIEASPAFRLMPLTSEIAIDFGLMSILRDPMDRTIAATARVHRLKLVTSDERIVNSGLVATVD